MTSSFPPGLRGVPPWYDSETSCADEEQKPDCRRNPKKQPQSLTRQCREEIEVSVGDPIIEAFILKHIALAAHHDKDREIHNQQRVDECVEERQPQ